MSLYQRRDNETPNLDEWQAQKALHRMYSHNWLKVPNINFGISEIDFLTMTDAGYFYEIEIKTTLSDWMNDRKKKKWNHAGEHLSNKISRFYYAVPEHLIDKVPDFVLPTTGLIKLYPSNGNWYAAIVRNSQMISDYKCTKDDLTLILTSVYHRYWSARLCLEKQHLEERNLYLQSDITNGRGNGRSVCPVLSSPDRTPLSTPLGEIGENL